MSHKKICSEKLASMLRVNYAGELAAVNMYKGQADVLKGEHNGMIKEMKAHEEEHLKLFTELMTKHRVRPSLLNPLWGALGYALGSVTATFGINGAFLGTRAVEKVIVEHYNDQIRELLLENDKDLEPLINTIRKCRDEEDSHHEIASNDKTDTVISGISEQIIENGCKGAIEIAKRI